MAQMRKKAPSRSICPIFCRVVSRLCLRSGFLKKKKTVAIAQPPRGRLILNGFVSDQPQYDLALAFLPEAPTPCQAVGKGSSQDWTNHRRNAKHARQKADVDRSSAKRY